MSHLLRLLDVQPSNLNRLLGRTVTRDRAAIRSTKAAGKYSTVGKGIATAVAKKRAMKKRPVTKSSGGRKRTPPGINPFTGEAIGKFARRKLRALARKKASAT